MFSRFGLPCGQRIHRTYYMTRGENGLKTFQQKYSQFHILSPNRTTGKILSVGKWKRPVFKFHSFRYLSTENVEQTQVATEQFQKIVEPATPVVDSSIISDKTIIGQIPEPPLIPTPDNIIDVAGEPSIVNLGLGGWSPIGLVQHCLEYLHVTLDIPWWGTIIIGTIIVRTLMFPLVIISQRNAAKMNNTLPQMQLIQLKLTEARQSGNRLEAARHAQDLMLFMNEKGLNPLKNMIVPLAQAPLFISFFLGLRRMANAPVESMKEGGLFWFADLTIPDQYFLLPLITSATMWATIELGTDSARLSSQNMQTMKYVFRALPIVILPFTINFPGAILCYWVSTNFISLAQVAFLKIPAVRDYFKIEPLITHKQEALPVKPKKFVEGVKDTWNNIKIAREMEDRSQFDEIEFRRAGRGPVVKTYKYDPTKVSPTDKNLISAKKHTN